MRYIVFVTLVSFSQCDGGRIHTDFQYEVETEQQCFDLAKEHIDLPFVLVARCQIQTETR